MGLYTSIGRAILVFLNILIYAFFIATYYFANQQSKSLFHYILHNRTNDDVSEFYYVTVTPAQWSHYVWYTMMGLQGCFLVYAAVLQFRKFPVVLNSFTFLLFLSCTILTVTWCVFWNRLMIRAACIVIFTAVFLAGIALALIYVRFNNIYDPEEHSEVHFWGFQLLVFNPIACYIAWLSYYALLCLATVMAFGQGITELTSTTVILVIMFVIIVVWFIVENTVFLWSTRYTLSIYPVVITALVASVLENWDPRSRNAIILVTLLVIVCVLFVLRLVRVVIRLKRARKTYATTAPPINPPLEYKLEVLSTRF